jgi:hypothetical protein
VIVVVDLSAREAFAPRELFEAYKNFEKSGPQYLNAETGLRAAAYWFNERLLIVYEESEAGVVVLTHPTSWKGCSTKSAWPRTDTLGTDSEDAEAEPKRPS